MAAHMSHRVPVTSRSDVEVHHLVLNRHELDTVAAALAHAIDGGGMPANHQIHAILAACREGLGVKP